MRMKPTPSVVTIAALALLVFTACRRDADDARAMNSISQPTPSAANLRYLALGDSYTIGHSVNESERWPVQLVTSVNEAQSGFVLEGPEIIAQTGWTTSDLNAAIDQANVNDHTYGFVTLLIGVNNQYQGLSVDDYALEFSSLLERCIGLVGDELNRVAVLSIPDYGYTPFGWPNQASISEQLEAFNSVCRDLSIERGVHYYNITPISQQWPEHADLIAEDGLHPSALQYTLWVDFMLSGIIGQLNEILTN